MKHDTARLTEQSVLNHARAQLETHLPLHAEGYCCTTEDLLNVLLGVAARKTTVEAVCTDLPETPDPATVRGYFKEQLRVEDLPQVQRDINAALAAEVPPRLARRTKEVAIDFHDQPYYGKSEQAEGRWIRAEAKDGTTRFYRVATAYAIVKQERVTLAIHFVLPEEDTAAVLNDLLNRLKALKIKAKRLYLDRGFANGPVIRLLEELRQPALIACPIRGQHGGTRALCRGQQSYLTPYTFESAEHGKTPALLAVCRVYTTAKRTRRHARKAEWMIFILVHLKLSPQQARRLYRRRFGIETSYRCARQVRGWTTSNNPVYRFLLMALSFLLLNVWLHLRMLVARLPQGGQPVLNTTYFQFGRFIKFLIRALEQRYGCIHELPALSPNTEELARI
jgi:hypothetical protein